MSEEPSGENANVKFSTASMSSESGVSRDRGPCRPTPTMWARWASVTGCSPGAT
ncbi:MAG TPA: hypothetical protein VN961_05080 [Streptosporangiaceae bacterium]|nr:hypothetical protein [Streptosporangiaceae bacterium]